VPSKYEVKEMLPCFIRPIERAMLLQVTRPTLGLFTIKRIDSY